MIAVSNDVILKALATHCETTRDSEIVVRDVGEDIVVNATQMSRKRTWQNELAAIRIPCGRTVMQVTLSGGMTELPQHGAVVEAFLSSLTTCTA